MERNKLVISFYTKKSEYPKIILKGEFLTNPKVLAKNFDFFFQFSCTYYPIQYKVFL